ncbi:MAG: short-chain fatty acyl-CoA regulator family protein [Polaromonas sp.]
MKLDLNDSQASTPIGMHCKVCERKGCAQRASPFAGRQVTINENQRTLTPYPVTD